MWVINNQKQSAKIYLKSDIESSITNTTDISNRIHTVIAAINRAVGGMPAGADRKLIDDCNRALNELSNALQMLYLCRSQIERLETREWIDDD